MWLSIPPPTPPPHHHHLQSLICHCKGGMGLHSGNNYGLSIHIFTSEYVTVQISRKVNVSCRRPAGRTRPDIMDAGCPFHRRPAVTPTCRHSTPTCARAADHTCRFLVEQWSAAASMYLQVAYATSRWNGLDH